MGYEEDWTAGSDDFTTPRGIISYYFEGSDNTIVSVWKVTGNLGGEDVSSPPTLKFHYPNGHLLQYVDTARGPLNEGGLFAERQGTLINASRHQPY